MDSTIKTMLPIIIMFALFYVVIIMPENRRRKKFKEMVENLNVNDEIVTRGGLIGKITNIKEQFVIMETGPDRSRVKLDKNAILRIVDQKSVKTQETKEEVKQETKEKVKQENKQKETKSEN